MKRILITVGAILGLVLAAIVVVLATRQDVTYGVNSSTGPNSKIDITPGKPIVFQPSGGGYARMSVSTDLPKTNVAPVSAKP
jgi:hypothetical protein